MSVNNIKEQKTVDEQNFDYLMAESNFRIESVFRQRNKVEKESQPTILGTVKKYQLAENQLTIDNYKAFATPDSNNTKTGGTFDYQIPANAYGIVDLRDGEFDIQAQFAYCDVIPKIGTELYPLGAAQAPRFGNQPLLSLFSQIQLFIDDKEIQCIKVPGITANAEFALRYPHCKTLESTYEINGYQSTQEKNWTVFTDVPANDTTNNELQSINVENIANNQSIQMKVYRLSGDNAGDGSTKSDCYLYTGFITQRIKLGDLFSCVDTLPPLYNHSILIRFNRSPNNDIICNTFTYSDQRCQLLAFNRFKYVQDTYVTTDQVIQYAKKYYSKPIETVFTQEKTIMQTIPTEPTASSLIEIPINVDAAYKNKLLTIAIPRTSNFSWQPNSAMNWVDNANNHKIAFKSVDNSVANLHYDVLKAPGNSYTYGGIRSMYVRAIGAGTELYRFTPEADGTITIPSSQANKYSIKTQLNFANDEWKIANYQNVYREYQKARLHFQQSEEEALDFDTFMKEFCIYCVDLSPFDISPGEQIKIQIETSSWAGTYNPYFAYNEKQDGTSRQASKSILCCLFCDKVLRLLPDARCEICDMISANSVEVENANMSV